MWLGAVEQGGPDSQTAIILGILTLLGLVLVALVTGLFQYLSARYSRSAAASSPTPADHGLYERVAILEHRADDKDDALEIVDRRLDQHERALDIDNPEWRHDGH